MASGLIDPDQAGRRVFDVRQHVGPGGGLSRPGSQAVDVALG